MTKFERTTLECPNCGADMPFDMYSSVNAQLNPELAERLMDGSLFSCTCPACGKSDQVLHPCLYNDMEHRLMVQLTTVDDLQAAADVFDQICAGDAASGLSALAVGYEKRVVTSQNVLREKAMIARDGFSDTVMELCKVVVTSMALEQEVIEETDELLYMGRDEENLNFAVLGPQGQSGQLAFPVEACEPIEAEYQAVTQSRAGYFVDEAWALQVLTALGETE